MSQRFSHSRPLHVLVSTPSGETGQGGIDRIMAALRHEMERRHDADVDVRFAPTRGPSHVALSVFYVIAFCVRILVSRVIGHLDVVHINVSSYGSTYRKIVIARFARLLGIPYVLHLHGSEYRTFWKDDHSFWSRRTRAMFEHAARVVVLGQVWRDFVAQRAPGATGNIVIVPNATEIPSLAHVGGGDCVHIIFLGRIGDRKGVPQLIEALGRLTQTGAWRATIAGDGDVETTRTKATELGLADHVALPGWVGAAEVASLIASADILVLPSFAENLPVSVIEGMAAGLAVIATPVGAVEEIIINDETGLLVPAGDVAALADALMRLIINPELRERLGAAALAMHRERLELAPFADALCNIWRAVVG